MFASEPENVAENVLHWQVCLKHVGGDGKKVLNGFRIHSVTLFCFGLVVWHVHGLTISTTPGKGKEAS